MLHFASASQTLPSLHEAEQMALALLPEWPTADDLAEFTERCMALQGQVAETDIGTVNHVHGDMLGRGVLIPAGTFVIGAVHKVPGFAFCIGDLTSWSVSGGRQRFTGAHLIKSVPGARIVFAHADTTWFTVHPNKTGGTDVAEIERSIVEDAHRLITQRGLLQ